MTSNSHREATLLEILKTHQRVALIGAPRTGLVELAREHCTDRPVLYASEYGGEPWSDIPTSIVAALSPLMSFLLVGGVHAARALRRGLLVDAVLYLDFDSGLHHSSDESLSKSTSKVFRDWRRLNTRVLVVSPDRLPPL